uniref:Uncharacterized protein n=1 Tax=Faecalibaculum rodentium TaxID=1702221 RepID=A0A140DU07_9FIRM|nr:hypothetical protein AALO17_10000 [Faecalibaculum rodentium]
MQKTGFALLDRKRSTGKQSRFCSVASMEERKRGLNTRSASVPLRE